MARLSEILEKHYFGRHLKQEGPTAGADFACTLAALTVKPNVPQAGIWPGVTVEDWPELPEGARVFKFQGGSGGAEKLNGSTPGSSQNVGGGVLLVPGPADLEPWLGRLEADFSAASHGARLSILAFDELRINLPGSPLADASSAAFAKLAEAGWQLRGFRDCQIDQGGQMILHGAWMGRAGGASAAGEMVRSPMPMDRVAILRSLLKVRQEQVERYRRADENRRKLHRKLKDRLRQVRKERKEFSQEVTRLKRRAADLNLRAKRLLTAKIYFEHLAGQRCARGEIISPYARRDLLETVENSLDSSPVWATVRKLAWSNWMRLGVLFQYEPRTLIADKLPTAKVGPGRSQLKISVVTPSYQQGEFLQRTMDSVLSQAYENLEYIVMDGGSTDGSRELIEAVAPKLAYWQSTRDGGQAAAIADGLKRSTGDIMAWLNSDDIYLPGTLRLVNEYFQRHPKVDVVYGHRIQVNTEDAEVGRWILPPHDDRVLRWVDYVPQESLFWRRSIYEKVGGLDRSFGFAMDWDLLLRFQKAGAKIVRLPYFYSAFRLHEEQKSSVLLNSVGAREVHMLRMRELGSTYAQEILDRTTTHYQMRARWTSTLLSMGIRV